MSWCPETSIRCLIWTKFGQAQKMDSAPVLVMISHKFLQVYMEAIPLNFRLVTGVITQTCRGDDAGLWVPPTLGNDWLVGLCKARVRWVTELIGFGLLTFQRRNISQSLLLGSSHQAYYNQEALVWWGFVFCVCRGLSARTIPLEIVFEGKTGYWTKEKCYKRIW